MPRTYNPRPKRRSGGYTLVELMVTLVITMLILIAGLSFYLMSRNSYATIDDNANLEERGNFALSVLTRLARQTAYVPQGPDGSGAPMSVSAQMINGLDSCSTPNDSETLACGPGAAINSSDTLMIRYYGVSSAADPSLPDGSVVDCSGLGVAGTNDPDQADTKRGLSILFVANGANGKPSLMCKYRVRVAGKETDSTFVTQELVPGVETMQVLYGVTTAGDEVPYKYVPATSVAATDWRNVVTAKIALVIRADNASADAGGPATFQLFGPLYTGANATYTPATDTRAARKLYFATVQIRNYQSCLAEDPSCI
ncbi:PilW family protein [Cupriavidus sp. RAF12]|uniref:PilW family protein n=1 Tax=Cupriavidus sp. RAF12 TaxID=3233050 RepID=UPI003F91330E